MVKLQIIGHLGRDCVVNNVNGRSVTNFSVAHSERYTDAQGVLQERTLWVECAYWSDRTKIAEYLKKGQLVYVEGTPSADAYMSTQTNQPAARLRLSVREIQLLGSSSRQEGNAGVAPANQGSTAPQAATEPTQPLSQAMPQTPTIVDGGADDTGLPF